MLDGNTRVTVTNTCKYNIGVTGINGVGVNITPGSYAKLTVDDIWYISNNQSHFKFFESGKLVALDEQRKPIPIEELGLNTFDECPKHLTDDEIKEMLKLGPKKLEAWISEIAERDDQPELYAIYLVAKDADLPASKLNILNKYIKDREWIAEDENE